MLTLHQARIDLLASTHLDSSLALSHQDEESLKIVNDQVRTIIVIWSIQRLTCYTLARKTIPMACALPQELARRSLFAKQASQLCSAQLGEEYSEAAYGHQGFGKELICRMEVSLI